MKRALAVFFLVAASMRFANASDAGPFDPAINRAQQCVVKLFGGTFGRQQGYASGVIVSEDGRIVTALSTLLEARTIRAVLPDGRSLAARVLARDSYRQLALLKVDASNLSCFDLGNSRSLAIGDWIIAAANPFKVAEGPEPVSVSAGIFSGRIRLAARARTQDFSYSGDVLITDVVISTPGCAGGALLDAEGLLIGVIGRPVISTRTNTWLNYAVPVEEVAAFVEDPAAAELAAAAPITKRDGGLVLRAIGIRLFDLGGQTRPAYIERVTPGSPAHTGGLRSNDLILAISGESVPSCEQAREILARSPGGATITVLVKRGDAVHSVDLVEPQP